MKTTQDRGNYSQLISQSISLNASLNKVDANQSISFKGTIIEAEEYTIKGARNKKMKGIPSNLQSSEIIIASKVKKEHFTDTHKYDSENN